MKYLFLCYFVYVFSSFGYSNPTFKSKFTKVTIYLQDGNKKEGLVSGFSGVDKKINFRKDEKAKSESILTSALKYMVLHNEKQGTEDTLYALRMAGYMFSKLKITDTYFLGYRVYHSNKIDGFLVSYTESNYFGHNRFGNSENSILMVQLPNQDYSVELSEHQSGGVGIGINKRMRSSLSKHIEKSCPLMVKKLEEENYKIEDFIRMLEDYTRICE